MAHSNEIQTVRSNFLSGEDGESLRYICDLFSPGSVFSSDAGWRSIFVGVNDPITGEQHDLLSPATSFYGAAVDHMMLNTSCTTSPASPLVEVVSRRVIPIFRAFSSDKYRYCEEACDHHALSCTLRACSRTLCVMTLNLWDYGVCPFAKYPSLWASVNAPDVIFFQEVGSHRLSKLCTNLSSVRWADCENNGYQVFGLKSWGLWPNVAVAIRSSRLGEVVLMPRQFDISRAYPQNEWKGGDKGIITVGWRPKSLDSSRPDNDETLLIAGAHLFGGNGSDECESFETGVRPEIVSRYLEYSNKVWYPGSVVMFCGDFNCQRPEDILETCASYDDGGHHVRNYRRDSFLNYARNKQKIWNLEREEYDDVVTMDWT